MLQKDNCAVGYLMAEQAPKQVFYLTLVYLIDLFIIR